MADLALGPHWEAYIREKVESGRFGSDAEVLRAALRELEARDLAFDALCAHVAQGAEEADRSDFVPGFSFDELIAQAIARG